jgi:hypothetical protein
VVAVVAKVETDETRDRLLEVVENVHWPWVVASSASTNVFVYVPAAVFVTSFVGAVVTVGAVLVLLTAV